MYIYTQMLYSVLLEGDLQAGDLALVVGQLAPAPPHEAAYIDTLQRGVQWIGGAVDGGCII